MAIALSLVGCSASPEDMEGELGFPDADVSEDPPPAPFADPPDASIPDVEPVECDPGFEADGDHCVVNKASLWDVHVGAGAIPPKNPTGGSWDLTGGPDGFVRFDYGFEVTRVESDSVDNEYAPNFDATLLEDISAAELQAHFHISFYDYDLTNFNDLIAECDLALRSEHFATTFVASDANPACPQVTLTLNYAE